MNGHLLPLNKVNDVYQLASERSLNDFLVALGGPSLLTFPGRDSSRCRVVVTLLHGNEPSGLRAVHALARDNITPAVTSHFIVASTAAAATPPWFSHRMLPGQPDLNRCFGAAGEGGQFALAQAILTSIATLQPECVIDLHNTSGSGPDFCVSTNDTASHQALAACFTSRMIVTDMRLGSLMEQPLGCPVVTIEAGGAKDKTADITAYNGLYKLLGDDYVLASDETIELLRYPRRLELKKGRSVAYLDRPDKAVDVSLRTDIESLNFGQTPAATHLGWLSDNTLAPLTLDNGDDDIARYFYIDDKRLYTATPLQLFMVTTNADIARSDCMFYFIRDAGQ